MVIEKLSKYQYDSLSYLQIHHIDNEQYLEQILNLRILSQLEYLSLIEHPAYFPFETLLKYADKWKHLKRVYINGYTANEKIKNSFKDFPQVIFLSKDRAESLGFDLAVSGWFSAM